MRSPSGPSRSRVPQNMHHIPDPTIPDLTIPDPAVPLIAGWETQQGASGLYADLDADDKCADRR